jgi:hypothetical protein
VPDGYTCEDVIVDTVSYKQCPNSGACDCNAALTDTTEPCTLTNPFGTCAGTACLGRPEMGRVRAAIGDHRPDATFTDDNCDGIDGTDRWDLVSARRWRDDVDCGQTYTDPARPSTVASSRRRSPAATMSACRFGRDYNEVVVMLSGSTSTAADAGWQRGRAADPRTAFASSADLDSASGGDNEYLTIRAHNLVVPTRIGDVIIVGPAASGGASGKGVHAVHVARRSRSSTLVIGGNGAAVPPAAPGLPPPPSTSRWACAADQRWCRMSSSPRANPSRCRGPPRHQQLRRRAGCQAWRRERRHHGHRLQRLPWD